MSQLLTIRELVSSRGSRGRYPYSRGTLMKLIGEGKFPPPIRLSAGLMTWSSAVLEEFDRGVAEQHRAITERRVEQATS
jgi:predicted DNA-binding transcriptional regulator AlpA